MEATNFDVESGLGSEALPSAGTFTTLVHPHTISKLLEGDIPENNVPPLPAPAPAPAPEPRPVQPVMGHAELWEHVRNFQSPYAPLADEEAPVDDDDEYPSDEEKEKALASTSAGPSKRRRTGEQEVHDQKLAGKAAVDESPEHPGPNIELIYTQEMLESSHSKLYLSTCSPPESTSSDGSEDLGITTPVVEPRFVASTDSKAGGVGEMQAQGDGEEQVHGVGEEEARGVGEER